MDIIFLVLLIGVTAYCVYRASLSKGNPGTQLRLWNLSEEEQKAYSSFQYILFSEEEKRARSKIFLNPALSLEEKKSLLRDFMQLRFMAKRENCNIPSFSEFARVKHLTV